MVAQVAAEITGLGLSRVMLWGHSSGAAFALATAAKLAEAGVEVARVFLGAQLPGDAARRRASVTELTGRSNAEIAAALSANGGYTELGELDAQRTGRSAPPTGTTAWPRTAFSPTPWTARPR